MSALRYALVSNGRVTNVVLWDQERVPDWKCDVGEVVLCDESVEVGFTYDGARFDPPAKPTITVNLENYKTTALAVIQREFERAAASMFVDPDKREELRSAAVAAGDKISAATTTDEVNTALRNGVATLGGG